MHDNAGLFEVVILLAAAIAAVLIVRRFKASAMLGYLAAGVVLGPYAFGMISDVEGTRTLAEFGVVFLLFSIGLDLSFKRLVLLRKEVFGLGTAQFVVTAVVVGGAAFGLGQPVPAAVILGAGLALSSTAIVMQILAERSEVATRHGRISFSILLLQDLAAVPLLAMVPLLEGGGGGTDWGTLGIAAAKAVAALAAIVLIGRYVLQPVFRIVAATSGPEVFFGMTLLVVLGTAAATQGVGLQLTLGAFLAGLLLVGDRVPPPDRGRHPAVPRPADGPVLRHHRHVDRHRLRRVPGGRWSRRWSWRSSSARPRSSSGFAASSSCRSTCRCASAS